MKPRQDLLLRLALSLSPLYLTTLDLFLNSVVPDVRFTPQSLIYGGRILPVVLSLWASNLGTNGDNGNQWSSSVAMRIVSHFAPLVLHSTTLFFLTPVYHALTTCWTLWLLVAGVRTIVGYVFTRSVGWMYPRWFHHEALYERSHGFGVVLAIYLVLCNDKMIGTGAWLNDNRTGLITLLCTTFYWTDRTPWTYAAGLVVLVSNYIIKRLVGRFNHHGTVPLPLPVSQPLHQNKGTDSTRAAWGWKVHLALGSYILANGILRHILLGCPPLRLPLPSSPDERPLLDILVLTFPRPPDPITSEGLLRTTLDSFLPHVIPGHVEVSVFTHAKVHKLMGKVEQEYESKGTPGVRFFADADDHNEDEWGHYLHLSEAFKWVGQSRAETANGGERSKPAEWIMLVEDDFPVCPGGWEAIETVMNRLETSRIRDDVVRSGFIGTGGSGLVIHHTYLPLLARILRDHSSLATPFPNEVHRSAPDQIVQDCLLGGKGHVCQRGDGRNYNGDDEFIGMIISSRLVLDHIGGMATTTEGKSLNSDRWRCGWRHPFHGYDGVEVVVI